MRKYGRMKDEIRTQNINGFCFIRTKKNNGRNNEKEINKKKLIFTAITVKVQKKKTKSAAAIDKVLLIQFIYILATDGKFASTSPPSAAKATYA